MDLLTILFFLLFLAFIVMTAVRGITFFKREFSGRAGRLYADVCTDLYRETERRAALVLALAQSREERLARIEKK